MYILEYYKQLREDSIKVQNHVFKLYQDVYMIPALHTFRVFQDNTITLENESEEHSLMDFAVYGHQAGGLTAIQRYAQEQNEHITARMQEFTQVALKNTITFFRVEHADKQDGTLEVTGLLGDQKDKEYCISDWGFSQTARPDILMFTRFIPFPESFEERDYYGNIGMTSGMSYLFEAKDQEKILKEGNRLARKYKAITNLEIRKQVIFFYLNRKFGLTKELI